MENKLNNLDQIIKETYEAYEAPYDPSHWESIQKELDTVAPSPVKYFGSITTGLVAASLVFMGMLLFVSEATLNAPIAEKETIRTNGLNTASGDSQPVSIEAPSISGYNTSASANEENNLSETAPNQKAEENIAKNASAIAEEIPATEKKQAVLKANDGPIKSTNEYSASVESSERSIRTGCTGLTIDFEASQEYGHDAKYLWNFGDGFFSNESNPSHTFNKPGTFDVSLSVTSYTTGQITSNVVQAMIDVVEAPMANMDVELIGGETLVLKNKSFRADEVEWSLDGESLGFGPEINLNFADNTRYEIELSALSAGGCTDTLYQDIAVSTNGASLPKQINFTQKETLTLANFTSDGKMLQFNVMDSGGKVKYSTTANQIWTGEDKSGKALSPGIYKWAMAVEKGEKILISKGEFRIF
jgi:PKD repeat protein